MRFLLLMILASNAPVSLQYGGRHLSSYLSARSLPPSPGPVFGFDLDFPAAVLEMFFVSFLSPVGTES